MKPTNDVFQLFPDLKGDMQITGYINRDCFGYVMGLIKDPLFPTPSVYWSTDQEEWDREFGEQPKPAVPDGVTENSHHIHFFRAKVRYGQLETGFWLFMATSKRPNPRPPSRDYPL